MPYCNAMDAPIPPWVYGRARSIDVPIVQGGNAAVLVRQATAVIDTGWRLQGVNAVISLT